MVAMIMVTAVLGSQDPSTTHVRTTEPTIAALIAGGVSRSGTFRHLLDLLNASDVIVYVEPQLTRQALGGFLENGVVARGGYRYLRVAINMQGAEGRIIPVLAHELQHALEVAQDPEAVDAITVERLFARLDVPFGCNGSSCSETQAAKDIENAVSADLKAHR